MKKLTITFLLFLVLLLGTGVLLTFREKKERRTFREQRLVALNEIDQLYQAGKDTAAAEQSRQLRLSFSDDSKNSVPTYWILIVIAALFLTVVYLYSYFRIIRPFNRLKGFAARLSQGDFDTGLEYTRADYFGDFTWAFDNMRSEIAKARKSEKAAIENNKTVIASLAHDLKTPVASLRAYTEGLEANMDLTPQKRQRYLEVIMKKCDEIARLTNDMTIHSLAGLDKLTVSQKPLDLCLLARETVNGLFPDSNDSSKIRFTAPAHPVIILADPKRVEQILENLLNNSEKYAGTSIDITISDSSEPRLEIRDYGPGIPNEDLPFIFDKFYRGHNIKDLPGSGLGLFIVKYLIEKQGGTILLSNCTPGLKAVLTFSAPPAVSE